MRSDVDLMTPSTNTPLATPACSAGLDFFPSKPLWTPEINRKVELIGECLMCDLPGSHIWGVQRVGKSEFAKYLVHVMPALLGGSAIAIVWSFLGCRPKKPEELLRRCLICTGCSAIASRDQTILQERLVRAVASKCRAAGARRVLLIADELQNVPPGLYDVLMSITSDLLNEDLLPHLLSIGQPEMRQTVKLMFDNNELQITGRLFPCTEPYFGLSLADVKELLVNMDGEGREFTRHHFPRRADEGWSIADLATPISQAVEQMLVQRNLTAVPRLPLGYLRPALNRMFGYLYQDPKAVVDGTVALNCFNFSGLPKVIGHYVEQPSN